MSILGLSTEWGDRLFQSIIVRGRNENFINVVMTVDRNILPGMKPTRHSFRCGQPLGPGVAHHGMRNLVHHAQAHVASPRGERLPAQVADHLSDAAYVVIPVASVPGRSALDHVKLVDIFLGMWVPYRRSIFQMWSY